MRPFTLIAAGLVTGLSLAASLSRAQPTEDPATAELEEHHRHHHHGGVTQFISMSLDTLGEDDSRRPQVQRLQGELRACSAPVRDNERALFLALAEGAQAGTVDPAKVDPLLDPLRENAAKVHACSAKVLNELHGLLSKPERQALAQKVEAHWNIWLKVNHHEPQGHVAELAREVSLTPEQVTQISSALSGSGAKQHPFEPARGKAHVDAFARAFASESFDAATLKDDANAELIGHGAQRMVAFYETAVTFLTPPQKTTLAQHLKERASQLTAPPTGAQP